PIGSILTSPGSSVSTTQSASGQANAVQGDAAQNTAAQNTAPVSTSTQLPNSGIETANLISTTEPAASQSVLAVSAAPATPQKPSAKNILQTAAPDGANLTLTVQTTDSPDANRAKDSAALPQTQSVAPVQTARTSPLVLALDSDGQTSDSPALRQPETEAQKNSDATAQAPLPNVLPGRPLPLSTDNLAFSLTLSTNTGTAGAPLTPGGPIARPIADARSSQVSSDNQPVAATSVAQSYANADDSKIMIAPPAVGPVVTSRALPSLTTAPNESRNQTSPDSSSRQQQDAAKFSSSERGPSDSIPRETTERAQPSGAGKDSASGVSQNATPNMDHQAPSSITSWLSGAAQPDSRPAFNSSSRPATTEPSIPASIQDIHALPADAPKTASPSEILLHLDNGQTSAAVRVVDRAGAVNVSVHASDQELRTSLRTNLNDLSAQLNAQGVKTESTRTASSLGSSENRSDQGAQDQRSNGQQQQQQQFSQQGDRQSPRGRRASAQWLDELQEQTSASIANPGGNNS
ncbi:MAG TPA: hypothetical protein VKG79_17635, partial [Bryobacteraceae bacterium]|nr:hypothetical protein [Bryobacteraceae bacterium]